MNIVVFREMHQDYKMWEGGWGRGRATISSRQVQMHFQRVPRSGTVSPIYNF